MAKFNDNKYRFSPEEIDRRLSQLAHKAVKEQMQDSVILSQKDILHIAICLKRTDLPTFRAYLPHIRKSWEKAKMDRMGYAQVRLLERTKKIFIDALCNGADTREMFDTLKDIMKWYGIIRVKSLKYNENYIPEDTRPGIYEKDQYDGTQWYEFVDQQMPHPDSFEEVQLEKWLKGQMEYERA